MAAAQRWRRLGGRLDRLLPLWFAGWSALRLWQLGLGQLGLELSWLGRDFRIYREAATAVIAGGDPWAAYDTWNGTEWHFGAPPVAAQLFVPFALVPEGVGFAAYFALGIALTLLALRRLGLPPWWILFPPMMEGIGAGNPHVLAFALLVLGGSSLVGDAGRAIAVGLKLYAIMPIVAERHWRAVLATVLLFAGSFLAAPDLWASYVTEFGDISGRLADEAVGGVSAALLLDPAVTSGIVGPSMAPVLGLALYAIPVALLVVVALRDVRAAGWIAVPLLWPAAQYSNGSFVLPVARRWSTWIIAVPTIPTFLVGLFVLCYEVAAGRPSLARGPGQLGLRPWLATLPESVRRRRDQ
jgi:hypothetical protein